MRLTVRLDSKGQMVLDDLTLCYNEQAREILSSLKWDSSVYVVSGDVCCISSCRCYDERRSNAHINYKIYNESSPRLIARIQCDLANKSRNILSISVRSSAQLRSCKLSVHSCSLSKNESAYIKGTRWMLKLEWHKQHKQTHQSISDKQSHVGRKTRQIASFHE